MIISEMNVKLTASTSGFAKAMDKAGDKTKNFRKGAGKVAGSMKAFGIQAAAAAAVVSGLVWGAKKIFDLGASIQETGSKFNTVFGTEASAQVSAFLDNFANKAGLTTNEAKGLVATTGAIAQGLGFTQKASGDMAIEITKLAGDLSSFNNLPTEQVLAGINSALTGEREQMKALGIVVQEADVQARAFANTGKTVAKALTQQEKATATLQIITEKAGSAVGDLDRTSGSAANVFKRLKARFLEIRDAIATALMPAFKHILTGIENSEGALQTFKQGIIDNTGVISAWAIVAIEAFKMVGTILAVPVRLVKNMADQLIVAWKLLKSIATLNWEGVTDALLDYWGNIKDVGDTFADVFVAGVDVVKAIGNAVSGANKEFVALQEQVNNTGAALELLTPPISEQLAALGPVIKRTVGDLALLTPPIVDLGAAIRRASAEDLKLLTPPIDDAAKSVVDLSETMAKLGEGFAGNFVDRMATAAQGGKDAFKGYFAYMKQQLIALAMKALLFKLIMGVAGKFGLDLGGFATSMTGFSPATSGASGDTGAGAPGAGTPILSGHAARASGGGTIVNQNINFSVSAIDGRDAARFIKEQGSTIAEVIATAAKDSTAYRRQLQGA